MSCKLDRRPSLTVAGRVLLPAKLLLWGPSWASSSGYVSCRLSARLRRRLRAAVVRVARSDLNIMVHRFWIEASGGGVGVVGWHPRPQLLSCVAKTGRGNWGPCPPEDLPPTARPCRRRGRRMEVRTSASSGPVQTARIDQRWRPGLRDSTRT